MSDTPNGDYVGTFRFGVGGGCCGKPVGCTMRPAGCLYPQHPWKREVLDGATDLRCQATSWPDAATQRSTAVEKLVMHQCGRQMNHEGPHDPQPIGVGCPKSLVKLPPGDNSGTV